MRRMSDLRRAIDALAAVRVGRTSWAYQEYPGVEVYVVGSDDLRALGRALYAGEPDAYSKWCWVSSAKQATPAQRARYELD